MHKTICSMADGISFEVSLSLYRPVQTRRRSLETGLLLPDFGSRVRSIRSAFLSYSQEMAVASSKGD